MAGYQVTKADVAGALGPLRRQAIKAGLMTEAQTLIYNEGVAAGGVPPRVWLDREGTQCPFLPTFEVISRKEQYRTIQGAVYALMAINQRNAEKGIEA